MSPLRNKELLEMLGVLAVLVFVLSGLTISSCITFKNHGLGKLYGVQAKVFRKEDNL